jgi:hypothetical protein
MALDILTTQKVEPTLPPQVSSLRELAKTLRTGAVARALSDRRTHANNQTLLELELQRPTVIEAIKDSLAQGVAHALATHDTHVQAVYAYDPSTNPDSEAGEDYPLEATLHLLVLVTTPSAALQAFISALDRALTESLKELPSPTFQGRESVLDINLLTPADVQQRKGYAGLLASVFAPAIKLWQR